MHEVDQYECSRCKKTSSCVRFKTSGFNSDEFRIIYLCLECLQRLEDKIHKHDDKKYFADFNRWERSHKGKSRGK